MIDPNQRFRRNVACTIRVIFYDQTSLARARAGIIGKTVLYELLEILGVGNRRHGQRDLP
jgi:hypothetical protein